MLHSFSLDPIRIAICLEFWLSELGSISHCLLEFCFGFYTSLFKQLTFSALYFLGLSVSSETFNQTTELLIIAPRNTVHQFGFSTVNH